MRQNLIRTERIAASYDVVNGWTVLEIDGEIDVHTQSAIREAVAGLLREGHRHFVLDLCFVPFLDSTALGAVVAITKRIRGYGGTMRIACHSGRMLKVFLYGGLSDAYEFYDSPHEATYQKPSSADYVREPEGFDH
ncbi:STAS domain-containing protein [Streptomyces naphthomycinicus]|uniref:STAS domain-containing protein n=1 Tax=Streptomyces naphthomycinicus TaxID=2872625 RepID=UPI001CECCC82|nr:STAS domain-containing protein [Streptomyces sp. TML10]